MKMLIAVAMGGAVGASARYLSMVAVGRLLGHGFPFGTLVVNIAGCFILGVLTEVMALAWSPSQEMRAFMAVGILGAFTTFSTFSLDAVSLFQRGEVLEAGSYVALSVILSIAAFVFGLYVFRVLYT